MRIDAHQHFWTIARGDYGWLTPDLDPLYRDFGPADLLPILARRAIDGSVLVQAAPSIAETEFLLELARSYDFIKGVVGWVDFESARAPAEIARLAAQPALVGLRPMIQDIPDPNWILRPDLSPALGALIAHDLTFDALTLPVHLPNLLPLLERHPDLRLVIDHGSKPRIRDGHVSAWAADIARIAEETAAFCKLSGLVTEAGPEWSVEDLKPYVARLLEAFGPYRLIWGSDWPVCTLAADYDRWCDATDILLADLAPAERAAILGGNASRAYRLRA